jgi:hypothetical protein
MFYQIIMISGVHFESFRLININILCTEVAGRRHENLREKTASSDALKANYMNSTDHILMPAGMLPRDHALAKSNPELFNNTAMSELR